MRSPGSGLNSKLFRQLEFGFAQLETPAPDIASGAHGQHDEIVFTQESHQHHRAFERYDEFAQSTETGVRPRSLRAAHERRKLRGCNVEVCFRAGLAEDFFDRDTICSHYERTEAALGAFDNGLKHLLEHCGLRLGTLTAQ